ncbi:2-(5'-triphosphoribosyl)-3'-dephospho CoA synthase [Geovibrio thiophilus]|uniref:triphosphoribosyl-dephospho-CoA synthase n=1 Tax=Geovibrio thiophilus TaxID=139438 RepID=A0A410JWN0_9BACT|nr:triphosphoribosyl-dephospho-CoA synthase [Geovibrio thiophilus]QAR32602.1 2-(5'-triphosphoribosyl)-3'-dephospho CoA synthase [Geovibrio thiophilus]
MRKLSAPLKNSSAAFITKISDCLTAGPKAELDLTPKPGLVDRLDSGSHEDLSYAGMLLSVSLLPQYYKELAEAALSGADISVLRSIGIEAERRMLGVCGSNAHKGYIFLSGLVLLASLRGDDLRSEIKEISEGFFISALPESNGETARRKYGTGGIISECLNGLPSVFEHALPAMEREYGINGCCCRARFAGLAELMRTAEDTTALHRCGQEGLEIIRADGAQLAGLLKTDSHTQWLKERNEYYKSIRLTMGGAADLLATGCAVMLFNGSVSEFL